MGKTEYPETNVHKKYRSTNGPDDTDPSAENKDKTEVRENKNEVQLLEDRNYGYHVL